MYSMRPAHMQMSWQTEHGYTFIHPFNDLDSSHRSGNHRDGDHQRASDWWIIFWFRSAAADSATGVSTLAKLLNPKIKVIGVEPAGANCMQASLKEGQVVTLPSVNTIADGTAVKRPGDQAVPVHSEESWMISSPLRTAELIVCIPGYGREPQDDR